MTVASTESLPDSSPLLRQRVRTSTDLTRLSACFADLWSSLLSGVALAWCLSWEAKGLDLTAQTH